MGLWPSQRQTIKFEANGEAENVKKKLVKAIKYTKMSGEKEE
jgi:hypothetical protein